MNELWKIGTDIFSYVEELNDLLQKNGNQVELNHNGDMIIFTFSNGVKVKKTKSTAMQFMRVLLSLGLLEGPFNKYELDKSTIREANYEIITPDKNTTLSDFLASNLLRRANAIMDDSENYIYPSESKFIFSLLATLFTLEKSDNEKLIDMRTNGHRIKDVKKYYERLAKLIFDSTYKNTLIDKTSMFVIGVNKDVKEIIDSINERPSLKAKTLQSDVNLLAQLQAVPMTFGEFVKDYMVTKTRINIPVYQRKYIWKPETVMTLLSDINVANKQTHYIGNIVVKGSINSGVTLIKVVDGQQRLTTLSLILRALFDYSKFMTVNVDKMINDKMVRDENGADNAFTRAFNRVSGNSDYDAFKFVMGGKAFTKEAKSNRSAIIENYKVALNWMSVNLNASEDIEKFWNNLLNSITFIMIDAKSSEEYKLFEKMNTGSTPLTTLELFKNYILSAFTDENISDIDAQTIFEKEIGSKFDGKNKESEIEKFIITMLRTENSVITKDTVFNQFKSLIEQKYLLNNPDMGLSNILQSIGKEIDLYVEISSFKKYSTSGASGSYAYLYCDFLYMLDGRSVYYPLIIRLIKTIFYDYEAPTLDEVNRLREFLRVIEIFEVRLQVAIYRGQSLSTVIESVLQSLKPETTPEEFWLMFKEGAGKNTLATSTQLEDALKTKSIANKPAKLILTRLENYFTLNKGWKVDRSTKFNSAIFSTPSQREHLLPVKWETNWKEYLSSNTDKPFEEVLELVGKYVNFIGNAFPIPDWSNNDVKNLSFEAKISKFEAATYYKDVRTFHGIDGMLSSVKSHSFTPEFILKRSEEIASIAKEIWKDYE